MPFTVFEYTTCSLVKCAISPKHINNNKLYNLISLWLKGMVLCTTIVTLYLFCIFRLQCDTARLSFSEISPILPSFTYFFTSSETLKKNELFKLNVHTDLLYLNVYTNSCFFFRYWKGIPYGRRYSYYWVQFPPNSRRPLGVTPSRHLPRNSSTLRLFVSNWLRLVTDWH